MPFRPFVLVMRDGDRVQVRQPENIARHAGDRSWPDGSAHFYAIEARRRVRGTFEDVVSVSPADA